MAIQNGFFKSINGDRRYLAEFFTSYFASFIGNGVFPNPSTNLQVINNQNFSTIVRPGKGWINGHYLNNDDNIVINHQPPDGVLRRIDRIVFSVNLDSRSMDIYLKQGTPSSSAVAPTLIRNSTLYELALADISFNPGMVSISQSNITDQRMNKNLCGIVHGVVEQLDTTTLFNQYQQFLVDKGVEFDQQLAVNQQIFDEWFAQLNDILDGDVAANLANMIITHTNNATPQKHIEVVTEIPQNLANKGLLLVVDDVDNPNNLPEIPTSIVLDNKISLVNQELSIVEGQLDGKANRTYVDNQLNTKRDKTMKITNSDLDTSSDANKIKLINLSNEVQQALTGNAPALSVIPDGSVVTETYANNSFIRSKSKTSLGSLQDGLYIDADNYLLTRDTNNVKIKFVGNSRAFYKNIELTKEFNLTDSEFSIPSNYSLVYNIQDNIVTTKLTDSLMIDDLILILSHEGVDKVNNLKKYKYDFNSIIFSSSKTTYEKDGNNLKLYFTDSDKRVFIRTGDRRRTQSTQTTVLAEYTIPHNNVLVFNLYSGTVVTRLWNSMLPDDQILIGSFNGRAIQNNIGAVEVITTPEAPDTHTYREDIIYFAGIVKKGLNTGNTININFVGVDNRLFYRTQTSNNNIRVLPSYAIPHNSMLAIDKVAASVVIVSINNLTTSHIPLIVNHNGVIKQSNIRVEETDFLDYGYVVNANEGRQIVDTVTIGQGITIIGDYLLCFNESKDDHTSNGDLRIYNKNSFELVKSHRHNFGHVNAVDYNPKNDSLVIGNNTASGVNMPAQIYIIHDATNQIVNNINLEIRFENVTKTVINLYNENSELGNFGSSNKPNACWGETNDIIYVIMNQNKVIYRIFLGRGTNNLSTLENGWGDFVSNNSNLYNGTCRVLGTYNMSNYYGVNQGMAYYKGKIYIAQTHSQILTNAYELLSSGDVRLVESHNAELFDDLGNRLELEPEGVAFSDGKIYQGYRGHVNGDSVSGIVITPL